MYIEINFAHLVLSASRNYIYEEALPIMLRNTPKIKSCHDKDTYKALIFVIVMPQGSHIHRQSSL